MDGEGANTLATACSCCEPKVEQSQGCEVLQQL